MKKILLFILFLLPLTAQAKIYIEINEPSSHKFPVAVPEFTTESGGHNVQTTEITSLLKKDLDIAGFFKVLDETSFLSKETNADAIDFSRWTAIEAHALVKGSVGSQGSKLVLEMRLYDTDSQQLLVGKQYVVDKKAYPQAIHRFMDELMKSLTGIQGPFSSKVVAACGKVGARQIMAFDIDGAEMQTLTKGKFNNIGPSWSPDGSSVVFTSFAKYFPEIFKAGADGKAMVALTNHKATTLTPTYSPNGSKIAYASSVSGDTELYLMDDKGHGLGQLTRVVNIDLAPAWSPDGSSIVFASERAGNLHLFRMDSSGGGATRLTYTGYQNDQPDWSSDGQKIVFTSRDRGAFDVFIMNADGSLIQRITRDEGNNESPTWSPDNRYIAFSSARGGGAGVYIMMSDGNNQMLVPGTGACINPDWSPRLQ